MAKVRANAGGEQCAYNTIMSCSLSCIELYGIYKYLCLSWQDNFANTRKKRPALLPTKQARMVIFLDESFFCTLFLEWCFTWLYYGPRVWHLTKKQEKQSGLSFFFLCFFCRVPMLLGLFSIVRFFSLLLPPQPGQCYLRPEKQPQEKAKLWINRSLKTQQILRGITGKSYA